MKASKTVTMKMHGHIRIPGGFTTQWPNSRREIALPRIKTVNQQGILEEMPFIPSQQIKAGWRRSAVQYIVEQQGRCLPDVNSYYYAAVGGDLTTGAAVGSILDYQEARRRDPVSGLFGSSNIAGKMSAGHVIIQNAIPKDHQFVIGKFGGTRADDAMRDPQSIMELVSHETLEADLQGKRAINQERTRLSHLEKQARREAAKMPAGEEKEAKFAEAKAYEKQRKELTDENAVSHPLEDRFEYVVAESFETSFTLLHATLEELGLLLHAIGQDAMNNPYLGGHKALGFGEYSASWQSTGKDNATISVTPFEAPKITGTLFEEAMAAFTERLDQYDISGAAQRSDKKSATKGGPEA